MPRCKAKSPNWCGENKKQSVPLPQQRPQQEAALMGYDNDMAGAGLDTAIDHHQVAVLNPMLAQSISADPHVKGADRVGNQGGMEIQALTQ